MMSDNSRETFIGLDVSYQCKLFQQGEKSCTPSEIEQKEETCRTSGGVERSYRLKAKTERKWFWRIIDLINPLRDPSLTVAAVLTFIEEAGQHDVWYLIILIALLILILGGRCNTMHASVEMQESEGSILGQHSLKVCDFRIFNIVESDGMLE